MIEEYIMSNETLNEFINDCEKFADKHQSIDYVKEINKVKKLNETNPNKAWNTLLESKVFYLAKGKLLNKHGSYVTIEN